MTGRKSSSDAAPVGFVASELVALGPDVARFLAKRAHPEGDVCEAVEDRVQKVMARALRARATFKPHEDGLKPWVTSLAAPASADEPQPASPVPPSDLAHAAREARFTAHVIEGDRARAAGRLTVAAKAYADALDVRPDPIVAGRLGVILVELGKPADAADLLLEGVQRGKDASKQERRAFLDAYDVALGQVTWLDVTVSHAGARITLDGQPKNQDGFSAFTIFVMPGEHELRATLDGHEAAVETFTATRGGMRSITLTLRPLPEPMKPLERLFRRHAREALPHLDEPLKDEPPKREPIQGGVIGEPKKTGIRGSVSAGPVMVFGVASWMPAVGVVVAGSLRPNDYVSLGVEGHAAWLPSDIETAHLDAMTAGGIVSACGHLRWFFGCALGYFGAIIIEAPSTTYVEETLVNAQHRARWTHRGGAPRHLILCPARKHGRARPHARHKDRRRENGGR
jgi:hypothetical protein